MFAINRILKVNERIMFLIISINTINLIKGIGVPLGTKWANILFVKFIHPKIKNPSHKGKAIVKFIVMCLLGVKIFGNSPIIFIKRISKKRDTKILLLASLDLFKAILNCSLIMFVKKKIKRFNRLGFFQNLNTRIIDLIKITIQFISIKILVFGSKETKSLKKKVVCLSFNLVLFFGLVYQDSSKIVKTIKMEKKTIDKIKGIDIGKIWGIYSKYIFRYIYYVSTYLKFNWEWRAICTHTFFYSPFFFKK